MAEKDKILYSLSQDLMAVSSPVRARHSQRFFRTGKGEYGEGDLFLGPSVPQCRNIARKYHGLTLSQVKKLLHSKFHEERLIALLILVKKFESGNFKEKEKIYHLYLNSTKHINNWDLVDLSASKIVGSYLEKIKDISVLSTLAKSDSLWERRIAIVSTFNFIKKGNALPTIYISELLLNDKEDLIHKAVGWMLREIGKRCSKIELENFLKTHLRTIPRTTLRYAVERLSPEIRIRYMKGENVK